MTTEEKFHAAVNVIRNLPKSGSYQPTNELMLRFYSYFKQATEGPCKQPKPGFWDLVKKAKWDAWKRLGNMSKDEAMKAYVEELKKIVETMAYDGNVESFMGSLDSFYESMPMPAQELDMILGPVIEKVRSRPGSPLNTPPLSGSPSETSPLVSRDASPSPSPGRVSNGTRGNKSSGKSGKSSKFYASLDNTVNNESKALAETRGKYNELNSHNSSSLPSAVLKSKSALDSLGENIRNIQRELSSISERIKRLEINSKLIAEQRSEAWGLIRNNLPMVGFLVLWPILTQLLSIWVQTKRRASR